MHAKTEARLRRAARTRRKIQELRVPRLRVHRTSQHIYAQLIAPDGAVVITSASSLDKEFKTKDVKGTGNIKAATAVGELIATRILKKGIKKIAFDRAGYMYHGRIKALADAARQGGLEF